MTQGQTSLTDSCQYLLRRPNEVFLEADQQAPDVEKNEDGAGKELSQEELLRQTVYIQHRPLKDPRQSLSRSTQIAPTRLSPQVANHGFEWTRP